VNPGRSGYDLCMETGQLVDDTRKQLTRFFNGTDPDRLVFSYNSTDALNLALFGLLSRGDHAITTTLEHNSVLRPLHHLAQNRGVEVDHVPFDARGFVDPDAVAAKFNARTRVVAINHASNVIGTVQPIAEIGRRCRERGIRLVVDASQTAGKISIDVQAMNVDVLVFTGHKSLMGPTGTRAPEAPAYGPRSGRTSTNTPGASSTAPRTSWASRASTPASSGSSGKAWRPSTRTRCG
jgi:selenocysteine lyase/cysteine desulfurase